MSTDAALQLLDNISDAIQTAAFNGISNLQTPLLSVLISLCVLAIVMNWPMYFDETWHWSNIIIKLISLSIYAWLIRHWDLIIGSFMATGSRWGMLAAGTEEVLTPTQLLARIVSNIYECMSAILGQMSWNSVLSGAFFNYLLACIALLIALYATFRIALVIFMATAEFFILGSLSIVLIPFGINPTTASISEKAWGILLTCTVKVLVATFIISLIGNEVTASFNASDVTASSVSGFITTALSLVFLAYLSAQAVDFAAAMTSGVTLATGNIVHAVPGAYRDVKAKAATAYSIEQFMQRAPGRVAKGAANAGKFAASEYGKANAMGAGGYSKNAANRFARFGASKLKGWFT